jgi:hypothetical protein
VRTGFGKNNSGLLGSAFAGLITFAGMFFIGPDKGAETSVYLASSPDVAGVTGKYFSRSAEAPSNPESHNVEVARRLWAESERLTGTEFRIPGRSAAPA